MKIYQHSEKENKNSRSLYSTIQMIISREIKEKKETFESFVAQCESFGLDCSTQVHDIITKASNLRSLSILPSSICLQWKPVPKVTINIAIQLFLFLSAPTVYVFLCECVFMWISLACLTSFTSQSLRIYRDLYITIENITHGILCMYMGHI